jgi:glycosyltransferase involved in cell wall biosynthesis
MTIGRSTHCDLSLIVPVYNAEASLPTLLDDLKLFPATRVQIVLTNDGSRDNSLTLCRAFEAERDNVVVINQPNAGVSVARNAAMAKAVGSYTGFCDSDDRIDAEALLSVLDKLQVIGGDMAVFNHLTVDKSSGRILRGSSLEQHDFVFAEDFPLLYKALCFNQVWNKVYKTDFLRRHQISFEPGIAPGQDFRFNMDAIIHLDHGLICDDRAYRYMVGQSESVTTSYSPVQFSYFVYGLGRVEQLMRDRGIYSDTFMATQWARALINSAANIAKKGGPSSPMAAFRDFKADAHEARRHTDLSKAMPYQRGYKLRILTRLLRNKNDAVVFFIFFVQLRVKEKIRKYLNERIELDQG